MSVAPPSSSSPAFSPRRRVLVGAAVALALPLLLVAVLVHYARRAAEREAAALEQATRVYANLTAWRLVRQSAIELHELVHQAVHQIDRAPGGAVRLRPSDISLHFSPDTTNPTHPVIAKVRRTFRVDFERDAVDGIGDRAAGDALIADLRREIPDSIHDPHQIRLEATPSGPVATLYAVIRTEQDQIRAIYGVETDAQVVRETLSHVAFGQVLLPHDLLGRPLRPTEVKVDVLTAGGAPLFALGTAPGNAITATDTLAVGQGGLQFTVALDSSLVRSLLLGSQGTAPPLRLIFALTLLAVALAAMALLHLDRARKLAALQTRFVSNVSHDLRTPLTHISMFAESIMRSRERTAEERRRFATIIHREARRLAHLVDGVLRFAREPGSEARATMESVDLDTLVREVVEAFQPMLDGRHVTLAIDIADRMPFRSDPTALRQILINVLDNAVKFGPTGQTVSVSGSVREGIATITVSDQGPGIPARDRVRVFEPFVRLDGDDRAKVAGAGIGLSVVRTLVARLGGTVVIDDPPRGGTSVRIELPVAQEEIA